MGVEVSKVVRCDGLHCPTILALDEFESKSELEAKGWIRRGLCKDPRYVNEWTIDGEPDVHWFCPDCAKKSLIITTEPTEIIGAMPYVIVKHREFGGGLTDDEVQGLYITPLVVKALFGGKYPNYNGFGFSAVDHWFIEGRRLVPAAGTDNEDLAPGPDLMLVVIPDGHGE
jgi:hypothetical protein